MGREAYTMTDKLKWRTSDRLVAELLQLLVPVGDALQHPFEAWDVVLFRAVSLQRNRKMFESKEEE